MFSDSEPYGAAEISLTTSVIINIIQIIAIINPAAYHQPERPVSCKRRIFKGIVSRYATMNQSSPNRGIITGRYTTSITHQNSERRALPLILKIFLMAELRASEKLRDGDDVMKSFILLFDLTRCILVLLLH